MGAQSASAATTQVTAQSWTSYCQSAVWGDTSIESAPSTAMWCRIQGGPAAAGGYTGPVDGVMGINSWMGMQQYLKLHWQYEGPVDGEPGPYTYAAMQRMARATSGNPAVDNGDMGSQNSWNYFNYAVKIQFFGL
ncbi:hypothetical protein [Agromyces larvae]|uniref:Peptidoglycan-binding protein n=1 Tax=Agromyces larvae TaxID=2929802 RepID=A0ABY4BXJ1_9MICO|nr:hypothetical protein [Agromyces larvae]UOE43849.1 hypothetical protein MTO99_17035 [Agromyces larvae]